MRFLIITIFASSIFLIAGAQPLDTLGSPKSESATDASPPVCTVGVYLTSIFDFSLSDKSYNVDFWMWFNYESDSIAPLESVELVNAKQYELSLGAVEKKGEINWATEKCRATIKKDWDIRHFPFDKQYLNIDLEDAQMDLSELVYVPDTINSKFDKRIKIDGWNITGFKIFKREGIYETTYGDPELTGKSEYPSIGITLTIEREGKGLFFKLFTGLYVAFGLSLLVFLMGPGNGERFGLLVGALFASIGNKYIVDGLFPQTTMFTLVDKIHLLTFAFILLNLILSVYVWRVQAVGNIKKAEKVDKISFFSSLSLYVFLNTTLIMLAR